MTLGEILALITTEGLPLEQLVRQMVETYGSDYKPKLEDWFKELLQMAPPQKAEEIKK